MENERGIYAFVRHGRTQWNIDGRIQGMADISLAPESFQEVYELASRLKRKEVPFHRIYTSSLQRTIQTGEIFKEVLEIESNPFIEPRFNERGAGIYEGLSIKDLDRINDWSDLSREPKDKFQKRVVEAFEEITERESGNNLLIVAHSAVIKAIKRYMGYKVGNAPTSHDSIFMIDPDGLFTEVQ